MWFCGIDIGTTHIKLVGVTEDGLVLEPVRARTPTRIDSLGDTVHDGEKVWDTIRDLMVEYANEAAADVGDLGGVCVATFGQEESFAVDTGGRPVSASRAWWEVPTRLSLTEADRAYFDDLEHYRISGLRYRPIQTPERIAKLRATDPGSFGEMARWVDFGTYTLYRLTGEWVTAANQITHSQLFRVADLLPDEESFRRLGIEPGLFAPAAPTGHRVGEVNPSALPGVPVAPNAGAYVGGHDQVVAARASQTGTGATAFDSIGTSEYVIALGDRFEPTTTCYDLGTDIGRGWGAADYLYGYASPSGKVLQLLARLFHNEDFEALMDAALAEPVASEGFAVGVSNLDGSMSGLLDLHGIPAEATVTALTRSVLDRLAQRAKDVLTAMSELAGADLSQVVLMGSLFRFPNMVEHRRTTWELPLHVSDLAEPVALGAAEIAAAAHGRGA